MEITARMKDEVLQWMGLQEKAMFNCNLMTGTEEEPVELCCLGYINGNKALHMSDIRPLLMMLGIDEDNVVCKDFVVSGKFVGYEYSIQIGEVRYYSISYKKWGEE